jgi:hypothetical protein
LKESQQAYDRRQKKKAQYTEIRLRGDYQLNDSEDDSDCELPNQTTSSLQQKIVKVSAPACIKIYSTYREAPDAKWRR